MLATGRNKYDVLAHIRVALSPNEILIIERPRATDYQIQKASGPQSH